MERSRFLRRLNRFVVECQLAGNIVKAHLPNSGRLWELLLPGRTVWLKVSEGSGKLPYTVMAVEKNGHPVMLHTQLTNRIVERLLDEGRIPGYEECSVERSEVSIGHSRIDFLLVPRRAINTREKIFLEVKTCTLFGSSMAMFPDAETSRGSRHVAELAGALPERARGAMLFVVQWPHARYFMPNVHVDTDFVRVLLAARSKLQVSAISVEYEDLSFQVSSVKPLVIPWPFIEEHAVDSGCYILLVSIPQPKHLSFRKNGSIRYFPPGTYMYVGRARRNLQSRMAYHRRKRKKFHWHIDRLTSVATRVRPLPIRLPEAPECHIARALANHFDAVPGFGVSDCSCRSHLFYHPGDPVTDSAFVEILMEFRVEYLEKKLEKLYRR